MSNMYIVTLSNTKHIRIFCNTDIISREANRYMATYNAYYNDNATIVSVEIEDQKLI